MSRPDEHQLSPSEIASLSALADGTLDSAQRPAVEAKIQADPRLRELYERERAAIERVRQASADTAAPHALRTRIAADRARRAARPRVRVGYAAALGATLAAVGLLLGLTLPGGAPGAPSISQAAALAARGPAQPAPLPNPRSPHNRLSAEVGDLYFPNWGQTFGWHAVAQRVDSLGQHQAVTVYYAHGDVQIAYTILSGSALPEPSGPGVVLGRYRLHTLTASGRTIVTWRRQGHTCVLSASGVPATVLEHLAAWRPAITE